MLHNERLQLIDELAVPPGVELHVDAFLDRRQPQLLEPADLGDRPGLSRELDQRRSPPQCECVAVAPDGPG
jgi:hypothetical protein